MMSGMVTFPLIAHAQIPNDAQQIQLEKDRIKAVQEQQPKAPDVRLEGQAAKPIEQVTLPLNETPNFNIRHIELVGDSANKFQFALNPI